MQPKRPSKLNLEGGWPTSEEVRQVGDPHGVLAHKARHIQQLCEGHRWVAGLVAMLPLAIELMHACAAAYLLT